MKPPKVVKLKGTMGVAGTLCSTSAEKEGIDPNTSRCFVLKNST